jgi:hypothetical protein
MKNILMSAVAASALLVACTPDENDASVVRYEITQSGGDEAMAHLGLNTSNANFSFNDMSFNDGAYTFTDVVFYIENDNADDEDTHKGKSLIQRDSDMQEVHAARMVIDSPRLDDDGNFLVHSFALEAISIMDENADAGSFGTIERINIDQPNAALSSEFAAMVLGQTDDDFDPSWDAYSFRNMSMDNFRLSEPSDGLTQVTIDHFAIENLDANTLERFEVLGFSVTAEEDGEPVHVQMDEFSFDGLKAEIFTNMLSSQANGEDEDALLTSYFQGMSEHPMGPIDDMVMRGLSIDVPGIEMAMDYLTVSISQTGDDIISEVAMGSFTFAPDASHSNGTEVAMGLNMLGYDEIEMSVRGTSVYDVSADRVYTRGDNYLLITDGLKFDFEQDFSGYNAYIENLQNVTLDDLESETGQFEMMRPLFLNHLSVRVEDLSLLDRSLTAGATMQGVDKEQLRAQAGMMIGMGLMQAPSEIPRPLVAELSEALISFVNNGGSITFDLAPPIPLSIGEIMDQAEFETLDIEALGLSISASE